LDEHLHALHEILEAAGNVGTLEDYLAECLSIIVSTSWLSPFPSAALFLSDKGSESLRLTAHHNFDPELLTLCANVPFGSCLCGQAASGNTILFSSDIDHFKVVNDRYGHAAGDRVLAEVSALMQVCCRDYDFSGRYGGEEFVFCLAGAKDRTDFIAVAERMRQQVERHPITLEDGTELRVTVSIGLALYDGVEKGVELVGRADRAMYQAKTAGRNRVQVDIPAKG
jgi:diguanylate cyclase (GGDEF)-like protein